MVCMGVVAEGRVAGLWVTCASLLCFVRGQAHPFPSPFTITSGLRRRWSCTGCWLLGPGYYSCAKAESQIAFQLSWCSPAEPLLIVVEKALGLTSWVLAKSNHILAYCKAKKRANQWCHPNPYPQVVTRFPVPSTTGTYPSASDRTSSVECIEWDKGNPRVSALCLPCSSCSKHRLQCTRQWCSTALFFQ